MLWTIGMNRPDKNASIHHAFTISSFTISWLMFAALLGAFLLGQMSRFPLFSIYIVIFLRLSLQLETFDISVDWSAVMKREVTLKNLTTWRTSGTLSDTRKHLLKIHKIFLHRLRDLARDWSCKFCFGGILLLKSIEIGRSYII